AAADENLRAAAILAPYGIDGLRGNADDPDLGNIALNDAIVALKRKIMLRPIPEDHPNFDGTNPMSRYSGTTSPFDLNPIATPGQIRFPFWEAVGPWDVDNDNDGTNESVWVDLGDPVQETENGRLYKTLYAFLIVDLDSRLNLNAHGSVDHFADTNFDPVHMVTSRDILVGNEPNEVGNLTGGDLFAKGNASTVWSSNVMPHGMGWGPGDVSLRSILSPLTQPYSGSYVRNFGDPTSDDYARLFMGRMSGDPLADTVWGRLGSIDLAMRAAGMTASVAAQNIKPGLTFDNPVTPNLVEGMVDPTLRDPATVFDFVGYPMTDQLRAQRLGHLAFTFPSAFGTSPDPRGRYAIGIDYAGQPNYEAVWDRVNPTNMTGPLMTPLVDDSPYETSLSSESRRGAPGGVTAVPNVFAGNDDAPFAVAEMERVLRGYDSETGTAPSRIWNLVDSFDPNKYVLTIASNPNNVTPEELALAQANTAIARRQVTTDSYEVPTPADVVPSYITELGPDGVPGNVGDDDGRDSDGDGNDADDVVPFNVATGVGEIGWYEIDPNDNRFLLRVSDDFASLTGKSVAQARLVDVLWYRIQKSRIERGIKPFNFNNTQAVAQLNAISEQLLPPEVLAGYKMDVNRPFGDGRDNNGNGIVDEPIEAGEPYVDLNGNGQWDGGGDADSSEPFVDLDGDGQYCTDTDGDWMVELGPGGDDLVDSDGDGLFDDLPIDNLWADQLGGNPALLSNAMGKDASGRQVDTMGRLLRDDKHLARQLYARHLYCLMMLLVDEEYTAPYDPHDPQVLRYLNATAGGANPLTPTSRIRKALVDGGMLASDAQKEARLQGLRRLTCRQIAQWAANCVDFRDSDACMTPFEYDENPWDGWNCVDTNGTPNDPSDDTTYPLDSDPATDENHGQFTQWSKIRANGNPNGERIMFPAAATVTGGGRAGNDLNGLDATRNVVWGAERADLLISEVSAFHDRRTEDLDHTDLEDETKSSGTDEELDQRLKPRGSLFVEVYNPWSGDGQRPTEIYSRVDRTTGNMTLSPGVELGRLSNAADDDDLRSPVWRIIVVEELPTYRNYKGVDNDPITLDLNHKRTNTPDKLPSYQDVTLTGVFKPTDPDWDEMLYRYAADFQTGDFTRLYMRDWQQEQVGTDNENGQNSKGDLYTDGWEKRMFAKPYPFIEREMYFNSGDQYFGFNHDQMDSPIDINRDLPRTYEYMVTGRGKPLAQVFNDRRVRIPFRFVKFTNEPGRRSLTFRFIAQPRRAAAGDVRRDAAIAPVLPGRYGVIGSAGTQYDQATDFDTDTNDRPRFTTTLGRNNKGNTLTDTKDTNHATSGVLRGTRRIELVVAADEASIDPNTQQVMVGGNGGNPGMTVAERDNERIRLDTGVENVHDADGDGDIDMHASILPPAVAIPVEDMNISEPVYGYEVRRRELDKLEAWREPPDQSQPSHGQVWNPRSAGGEGG
ncbi:MAG: hypothetical protein ACR2NU_02390, partial [Aeoliella sp.]